MAAYGQIAAKRTTQQLPTRWTSTRGKSIIVFHLNDPKSCPYPDLLGLMFNEFADEVGRGNTYPQEGPIYKEDFLDYFCAADVCVALFDLDSDKSSIPQDIGDALGPRTWEEAFAGAYYVKPNYPGRSRHICNAGFVVSHRSRGSGVGKLLGQSYLHYAPRFGYEASVFNLVYVNNVASAKIWDSLGFQRAGLIPRAGRLKKQDGEGEEFVDAIVFYRKFDIVDRES